MHKLKLELQQQDTRTVLIALRDTELASAVVLADDLNNEALAATLESLRDQLSTVIDELPEYKTWIPAECPNYAALLEIQKYANNALAFGTKRFEVAIRAVLQIANTAVTTYQAKMEAPKPDARPTLTAEEWADVAIALQTKMDSPSAAGDDHLTRTWRSHLATLIEEVNAHEYDFNADDWVEIYYAVVDSDANQNIAAKIGPDGTNMWGEPQPLNTEDAIAAAIDRDKAKGIDWQGVGVIDTRKRTDSIGVHLDPHNWQQTR